MKANSPSTSQLTSEQLDVLLHHSATMPAPADSATELAAMRALFTDLRDASRVAAQAQFSRASVIPVRRRAMSAWALTAAAIALCATPFALHHHAIVAKPVVVEQTPASPAPVSDEVLFADVQSDIDAAVPSPMLPLTADSPSTQSTTTKDKQ